MKHRNEGAKPLQGFVGAALKGKDLSAHPQGAKGLRAAAPQGARPQVFSGSRKQRPPGSFNIVVNRM